MAAGLAVRFVLQRTLQARQRLEKLGKTYNKAC
jgi:hypothetical protein